MVIAWWHISAHKWFKGPTVNVEHSMLGRDVSHNAEVINGIEEKGPLSSDSGSEDLPMHPKGKEAFLPPAPNAPIHELKE